MNIAFTSIVLFILLAPGFIFRLSYQSSSLSLKATERNILNDLTWSIVPSIIIQIVFLSIVEIITDYYIDFEILGNLMLGVTDNQKVKNEFLNIKEFLSPIFAYTICIFSLSYILGYLTRRIVRWSKFDRTFRGFRFSNKWHYILTGECLDFPHVPDTFDDISIIIIDILCKINGKSIIYIGEFFDYYIDGKGNLEAIHIRYPLRRDLEDDSDNPNKYYEIPGRFLIIPNTDILNINMTYLNITEVESGNANEFEEIELE